MAPGTRAETTPAALARAARMRYRLARHFALRDLAITLAGAPHPVVITLPADPDASLDEMAARQRNAAHTPHHAMTAQASDESQSAGVRAAATARATVEGGAHLPYWALLWPSGLALAEALLADPDAVCGARALELGCGLGATAAITLALGARLTISDLFSDALLFASYNALRCAGSAPASLLLNWRTPTGYERLLGAAPFDLLLAADVLYEQEDIEPLLTLAPALLRPGAQFWLAEPGRKASRAFVVAALARGWRDLPSSSDCAWPPDGERTRIIIHRFSLP